MKKYISISFTMGALMLLTVFITKVMTPTIQIADMQKKIDLENMIPLAFEKWKIYPSSVAVMVNPEAQGLLNKVYSQTLSRTYINNDGERVMLSIAYGVDQTADLHVHRPEICYAASGFNVGRMEKTFVDTSLGQIPVMHLVAKQGARSEPITYWIRIGDSLTRGWLEQKLTAIGYGLSGKVPDGLLFRVSTISNDEQNSYQIQQSFLAALLLSVPTDDRYWLVGQLASQSNLTSGVKITGRESFPESHVTSY